jgi:hypothetical protein
MASNKRRGHLDQPTRNHLSAIEAALAELIPKPKQPDEFTTMELWESAGGKASGITLSSIRCRLDRAIKAGSFVTRKVIENGSAINLYRKP